ncbi:UNVERIFIED_CONTAM: hypothetical protein PYX00_009263 [Menopon gallinae]|uniref:Uncharacterized protein n=1 Tax=Menopon gallinae TaxID=328185 RepID=A0AAW2HB81_9NEOP
MKFLIILSAVALCAAAVAVPEEGEAVRTKRGLIGFPAAVSYSSQLIHHTPSIPVTYHAPVVKYVAPLPAVKVIQPYPIAKIVAPAVSYTKVSYPSVLPYYGYGYGFGHYH